MKKLLFSLILGGVALLPAENLIFNGSFKLGESGFALKRLLRPDTNPKLEFTQLSVRDGILELSNPYAENFEIHSREFLLKPETDYRFQVKLQSSKEGAPLHFIFYMVTADGRWIVKAHTFSTAKEWKEYSYEFNTGKEGGYYHIQIRPGDLSKPDDTAFRMTGFQLAPKGAAPGFDGVEATAIPAKTLYTLESGEQTGIIVRAANPSAAPVRTTLQLTGKDEYTGQKLFGREFQLQLAPGEVKEFTMKEPLRRYGAVSVELTGDKIRSFDGFYAVIGKYESRKIDVNKEFCVALNDGTLYLVPPAAPYHAYVSFSGPQDDKFRIFQQMGCRLIRDYGHNSGGVAWHALEPERGKYDYRHLDRSLEIFEKYGITMFPVIGENYFIHRPERGLQWPTWVEPLSERVKDDTPNVMPAVRGKILLPPIDLWKNYVAKFAARAKGKTPIYEIVNEPNLFLAPDVYVKYLKAAFEAIREEDPDAKVVGFCLSSDFGVSSKPWMDQCIAAGGLKYVDGVGFHPYGGRELNSVRPADLYIEEIRKDLAPYGDYPLYNTELYFIFDGPKMNTDPSYRHLPHHVAWRFLVDLGEGVKTSICLNSITIWKRRHAENMFFCAENYYEYILSDSGVMLNTMARLFEGAKAEHKFRYPNGSICYVYRKNGKLIAAIWNYQHRKGISADFSKFEVLDLFGNPGKPGVLPVADAPWYLRQGSLSESEFVDALKSLKMKLEIPVAVSPVARRIGDRLWVTLTNEGDKACKGSAGISGDGITAKKALEFELAPNEARLLEFEVKAAPGNTREPRVMLYINDAPVYVPVKIVDNAALNSGETFTVKSPDGKLSGSGRLTLHEKEIVLDFEVRDATPAGRKENREIWETDGVELFFDLAPEALDLHHPQTYTPKTFRVFILPREAQGEQLVVWGEHKAKLNLTDFPGGYRFTLTIPEAPRKHLGFELKINDAEGNNKAARSARFADAQEAHKNRCNFGVVTHVEK